ncbi:MAG: hypothetical protein ACRCUY_09275 [Thermoguttaceae bacterium]
MAKDNKPDLDDDEVIIPPPTSPKSIRRVYILVGLVCLVLFQTTILALVLPSGKQTVESAQTNYGGQFPNVIDDVPLLPLEKAKEETVEKPLGEKFRIQDFRGGSTDELEGLSVTVHVSIFKKDETAFDKLYEKKQMAVRDAVTQVLRSSSREDRTQVNLMTIKNKVQKAVNEVLGTPYVRGVICTDLTLDSM